MAIDLAEQDGQTPLDPDEGAGLIPVHLSTKGELNDWEQENVGYPQTVCSFLAGVWTGSKLRLIRFSSLT